MRRHGIACDWARDGRFHAAVSQSSVDTILKPQAAELDQSGEPHAWYDRDALAAEIGTNYYAAAVFTPGGYP